MIDVVSAGLAAAGLRSPLAYPIVFASGMVTSIGPCTAPRYVAVAALVETSTAPARAVAAFVAGVVAAYVALGLASSVVGALWLGSHMVYGALAVLLALSGLAALVQPRSERHAPCAHRHPMPAGFGGAFLLGASGVLIVSPCCTPIVVAIAGTTLLGGRCVEGLLLLCAFSLGHALPLAAAGTLGRGAVSLLARLTSSHAPAIVSGTLLLALAAYYGILA